MAQPGSSPSKRSWEGGHRFPPVISERCPGSFLRPKCGEGELWRETKGKHERWPKSPLSPGLASRPEPRPVGSGLGVSSCVSHNGGAGCGSSSGPMGAPGVSEEDTASAQTLLFSWRSPAVGQWDVGTRQIGGAVGGGWTRPNSERSPFSLKITARLSSRPSHMPHGRDEEPSRGTRCSRQICAAGTVACRGGPRPGPHGGLPETPLYPQERLHTREALTWF